MQLGVGQGSIEVTIFQLPAGNTVEVDTPNGSLTLLGAGSYRVDTNPTDGSSVVTVFKGSLEVTGSEGATSQVFRSGQAARLTGTDSIAVDVVSVPSRDDFDTWCADRDKAVRAASASKYVDPYIPGVEELDSHGYWKVVADLRPCVVSGRRCCRMGSLPLRPLGVGRAVGLDLGRSRGVGLRAIPLRTVGAVSAARGDGCRDRRCGSRLCAGACGVRGWEWFLGGSGDRPTGLVSSWTQRALRSVVSLRPRLLAGG